MRAILRRLAQAINGGSPDSAPTDNFVSALDIVSWKRG